MKKANGYLKNMLKNTSHYQLVKDMFETDLGSIKSTGKIEQRYKNLYLYICRPNYGYETDKDNGQPFNTGKIKGFIFGTFSKNISSFTEVKSEEKGQPGFIAIGETSRRNENKAYKYANNQTISVLICPENEESFLTLSMRNIGGASQEDVHAFLSRIQMIRVNMDSVNSMEVKINYVLPADSPQRKRRQSRGRSGDSAS